LAIAQPASVKPWLSIERRKRDPDSDGATAENRSGYPAPRPDDPNCGELRGAGAADHRHYRRLNRRQAGADSGDAEGDAEEDARNRHRDRTTHALGERRGVTYWLSIGLVSGTCRPSVLSGVRSEIGGMSGPELISRHSGPAGWPVRHQLGHGPSWSWSDIWIQRADRRSS
jgi:hypothetical protein